MELEVVGQFRMEGGSQPLSLPHTDDLSHVLGKDLCRSFDLADDRSSDEYAEDRLV